MNFKYDINLNENAKYEYNYQITATTEAVEKNNKDVVVFTKSEDIVSDNAVSLDHKSLNISKNFNLDYQKYNQLI